MSWVDHQLVHQGRTRRYFVHTPPGRAGSDPLPVVLNFHGGLGNAHSQQRQSRMDGVADEAGFLVVYPEGTGRLPGRLLTFNAGTCCGYALRMNVDDVGFVARLLDELPQHHPVDLRRIYATGMSNGAMLCYRLACELSERIAAIAPVSGTMGVSGQTPKRPVPVLHFHGLEDRNCPYRGGVGENRFQPNPHRSVEDTLAFWLAANRCIPEPDELEEEEEFIRRVYRPEPGDPGQPIELYVLPRGGHSWPGGEDITRHLGTGRLVTSVDASRLIWQFFQAHAL